MKKSLGKSKLLKVAELLPKPDESFGAEAAFCTFIG